MSNFVDTPQNLINRFSKDYPEIPSVLTKASQVVPKYKGSVQPYQAAFLYWLVSNHVPTYGNVLEIGTGLGYTAYVMAFNPVLSHEIVTVNPNKEEMKKAWMCIDLDNITYMANTSREIWDSNEQYTSNEKDKFFDLIFIDGDHKDIGFDIQWYDRLKTNGVIVFHDYSPQDSWSSCIPVWNKLNEMFDVWGEPLYTVFDDGNVGMIAWQKK